MYTEWLFCSSKGVPKGIFLFERKPLVEFTHLDLDSSTFKDAYCIYSHLRVHMSFVYLDIIVMIGFFRPIPRLRHHLANPYTRPWRCLTNSTMVKLKAQLQEASPGLSCEKVP